MRSPIIFIRLNSLCIALPLFIATDSVNFDTILKIIEKLHAVEKLMRVLVFFDVTKLEVTSSLSFVFPLFRTTTISVNFDPTLKIMEPNIGSKKQFVQLYISVFFEVTKLQVTDIWAVFPPTFSLSRTTTISVNFDTILKMTKQNMYSEKPLERLFCFFVKVIPLQDTDIWQFSRGDRDCFRVFNK